MTDITIKDGIKGLGVFVENKSAKVSSRFLAKLFGKEHNHVMRDIRDRVIPHISDDFRQSNFGQSSYINSQNKKQPEYNLTFDGFTIVAMGFTGKEAMIFKESYIKAFYQMKDLIFTRILSKEGYKEMSQAVHDYIGDDSYYYAKEANMINMAVLGMRAADFKKIHGIKKDESIRDSAVSERLTDLDKAQRMNGQLIIGRMSHEDRNKMIISNFGKAPF